MEEPKLRDSKKAGTLTFSNLNYVSLSLKLQEKSASGGRAMAQEVLSKSSGQVDGLRSSRRKIGRIALLSSEWKGE